MYTTRIATISSTDRLPREFSNAWAAPWEEKVIPGGRVSAAMACTFDMTSPSAKPGFRLNEIVTAGSIPKWLMDWGPTSCLIFASVSSGISRPGDDLKYRRNNDW